MDFDTAINEWSELAPPELIHRILETYGARAAIGTSMQKTGLVTIDLAAQTGLSYRVYTVDSLRLFPETYAYRRVLEERFGIQIEVFQPDPGVVGPMVRQFGEHLFYRSIELRKLCCHNRKVRPNEEALKTLDIWITGIRHDQSESRQRFRRMQTICFGERRILKVAPLIDWSEQQLETYIQERDLPVHPLYEWRNEAGEHYKSIGCHTCTVPVLPQEDQRSGRWPWEQEGEKKECGIQLTGGAGI